MSADPPHLMRRDGGCYFLVIPLKKGFLPNAVPGGSHWFEILRAGHQLKLDKLTLIPIIRVIK